MILRWQPQDWSNTHPNVHGSLSFSARFYSPYTEAGIVRAFTILFTGTIGPYTSSVKRCGKGS